MNTPTLAPSIEPRWQTYLLAVFSIFPAVVFWGIACTFLVPKVREICEMTKLDCAEFRWVWEAPFFLVRYGSASLVALILVFALLELVGRGWPPQRRIATGVAVLVVNFAVLFGLTTLLILVLMAAPSLAHPR